MGATNDRRNGGKNGIKMMYPQKEKLEKKLWSADDKTDIDDGSMDEDDLPDLEEVDNKKGSVRGLLSPKSDINDLNVVRNKLENNEIKINQIDKDNDKRKKIDEIVIPKPMP